MDRRRVLREPLAEQLQQLGRMARLDAWAEGTP
jgi:hypothetical protein